VAAMRYVIVDQDGASRGHFDVFSDVLKALDDSRADEEMLREFCVLQYDDQGERVGVPIEAVALLPRAARDLASLSLSLGVAETYGGTAGSWHVQQQSSGDLQPV
jgi:hypothetical protein